MTRTTLFVKTSMTWLTDLPSAVSATFSCDAAVYRYLHCVRLQEKGVGLIGAPLLKQMMIEGCKVSLCKDF